MGVATAHVRHITMQGEVSQRTSADGSSRFFASTSINCETSALFGYACAKRQGFRCGLGALLGNTSSLSLMRPHSRPDGPADS